jgi:pimeloyl-ACP methyl ester carboxylesterase
MIGERGMPLAQIGDIRVCHALAGRGPSLLYISGTAGDLRNEPNIFASPLAAHFSILAFDQRGPAKPISRPAPTRWPIMPMMPPD